MDNKITDDSISTDIFFANKQFINYPTKKTYCRTGSSNISKYQCDCGDNKTYVIDEPLTNDCKECV